MPSSYERLLTTENKYFLGFSLTIIFALLNSPVTYKYTNKKINKIINTDICTEDGLPYASGLVVHSVLFFIFTMLFLIEDYRISLIIIALLLSIIFFI